MSESLTDHLPNKHVQKSHYFYAQFTQTDNELVNPCILSTSEDKFSSALICFINDMSSAMNSDVKSFRLDSKIVIQLSTVETPRGNHRKLSRPILELTLNVSTVTLQ